LRRVLHAELRYTHAQFREHFKAKHAVRLGVCRVCPGFRERIRTLNFALEQAGGRKMDESYSWGPVEGA
jgi:hypothetical protein